MSVYGLLLVCKHSVFWLASGAALGERQLPRKQLMGRSRFDACCPMISSASMENPTGASKSPPKEHAI